MADRRVPLDVFVGREEELAQLAEVASRVAAGQPWLVALEGEPGMGKTALVRRCLAQARGLKVLWARADQAETDLDFGVVDQLLRAAGDAVPAVPSAGGAAPAASSFAVGAHLLGGLSLDEVAALAAALEVGSLGGAAVERLHRDTGGHPLYLRTALSDGSGLDPRAPGRLALPSSLAAAVGDHLRALPPETRSIVEMLSVLNLRLPLAQLGQAAQVDSPGELIEPAVAVGLVDWWPEEPTCPVEIRHLLVRDAIYAGITATQRRLLHARAASCVSESASWEHRVAALDRPDEALAAELEQLADQEAASFRLVPAATHLRWASDISPARADRERRLLTAALYLADEAQGVTLLPAVEAAAPSPLRSYALGALVEADGQLAEAERWYRQALAEARDDPGLQPLAATIAARLAGTYTLRGEGDKTMTLGRWALGTGCLDPAATRQTRTRVAIGASQAVGPREALAELGQLDPDPARVGPIDVDGLAWRGMFRLMAGDLGEAVTDLTASLKMVRRGAALALGHRAYGFLALAHYLAGDWDDALLSADQGLSAAVIHPYRHELPLLHLAAGCVPAGRGAVEEAQRHARLAEEVAASLDYGQEQLYAAMARALVGQAAGDYLSMADALGPWRDDAVLDGRSRRDAVLWRPLLAEGLIGSGQAEPAAAVLARLGAGRRAGYLQPALAWLDGWLAELQGRPEEAQRIYQLGEDTASTQSPFYTARLLLAHGRLLRRKVIVATGVPPFNIPRETRGRRWRFPCLLHFFSTPSPHPVAGVTGVPVGAAGRPQRPPSGGPGTGRMAHWRPGGAVPCWHGIQLLEEDLAMSDRSPVPGGAGDQPGSEPDLSATDEFAKMRAVMRASEKHREGGVDPDPEVPDADPGPDT